MLRHLSITNYALIEHLELSFDDEFTVITGETGAGKSILLGALSLILGNRADITALNNKEKKCIVEGTFIVDEKKLVDFFEQNDLDLEKETVIRREINAKGKSRAFVNDTPVSLSLLKELASPFLNIHSQNETMQLQQNKFQIDVVDSFAGLGKEVGEYTLGYREYLSKERKLNALLDREREEKADMDYVLFQRDEIRKLNLQLGEQQHIEEQIELADNSEAIKTTISSSSNVLNNMENSVLSLLSDVTASFSNIRNCSSKYETIYERLKSVRIELEDIVRDIDSMDQNVSMEQNTEELKERLGVIYGLLQKHTLNTGDELLEMLEKLEAQLSGNESLSEEVSQLKEEQVVSKEKLLKQARQISKKRSTTFNNLTKRITSNLSELGMPDAKILIDQEISDDLSETGIDHITFLFSANKGFELKPIAKTASGGELSRLMLTIKSILVSDMDVSSLIFDEIDTGVSGDIADKMGNMMKEMGESVQVISITHLPQVAAKGSTHFKIYKENIMGKTNTLLKVLHDEERIEEIAKMLSGKEMSEAAIENAKVLLV